MSDDMDITPASVWRAFWKWAGPVTAIACAAVVLGAVVFLVGWRIHWWFAAQNANNQAKVTQNGYSNQQSQRGELEHQIANVEQETVTIAQARGSGDAASYIASLEGQRAATVSLACGAAVQINGSLPPDQSAWVSTNCLNGSIRPGSPYYVTGNGS